MEVSGPAEVQLGFLDVRPLPFIAEPESIEVGITCGMDWMCGQDPCLCGSSDAWGACSCNGLQEVRPTFALAASDGSQLGFVHLVKAFDRVWLVSAGAGEANALLTAELVHYAPASVKVHISSAPFGLVDVLKLGVVALAAAGIVALVRLAVIRALGAFRALKRRKERI